MNRALSHIAPIQVDKNEKCLKKKPMNVKHEGKGPWKGL